jgi:predicted aspartyl protease
MLLYDPDVIEGAFASGMTEYLHEGPGFDMDPKLWISFEIDGTQVSALLDTGAPCLTIQTQVAETLGLFDYPLVEEATLTSRFGKANGRRVKTRITLVATNGNSLEFEPLAFVAKDYSGPTVMGYSFCLQLINFAIDPSDRVLYWGLPQGN